MHIFKKLFSMITIVAILCLGVPSTVSATTDGTIGQNISWSISDTGTLTINGTGEVRIDTDEFSFQAPWYEIRESIKKVIIGSGITNIGYRAFKDCTNLTDFTIPDSVVKIDQSAFENCSSLATINIGKNVKSIDDYAFNECTSLTTILWGEKLELIGGYSFNGCTSLVGISLPGTVCNLGEGAFRNCENLATITVPDNVKEVPANTLHNTAFYDTESNWTGNILYVGNHLVDTDYSIEGEISIKDSTVSIAQNAFSSRSNVTRVTIPDTVKYIGSYAFASLNGLTEFDIPNSVTEMGEYTFYMSGLSEISLGTGLKEIPKGAFYETKLTAISIPQNITRIGEAAFSKCSQLASVTFLEGLKTIEGSAFEKTAITRVEIPDSVTELGNTVFSDCANLKNAVIGDGVEEVGSTIFGRCTLDSLTIGDKLGNDYGDDLFTAMISLEELILGDSVTDLNKFFTTNSSIKTLVKKIKKITLGNGIYEISSDTFDGFTALTDITLGDNIKLIDTDAFIDTAFYNNADNWENGVLYIGKYLIKCQASVTTVNIKTGTTLIAASAFREAYNGLTSVTIPDGLKYINHNAFMGLYKLENISLPDSIVEIGAYAFMSTKDAQNVSKWTNGKFYLGKHLIDVKADCTDFTIKDDTLSIAGKAFDKVKSTLTEIVIPNSVLYIAEDAFRSCSALKSVTFGQNLKSIGNDAFYNTGITSIDIPATVESIGDGAFSFCYSLTSAEVNCKTIANEMFRSCTALEVLHINDGVETIDKSFANCTSLERVRIPDSVKYIADYAFTGCTKLRKAVFGTGLKTYNDIFYNTCTNLQYIVIPESDAVFDGFLTRSKGLPNDIYFMGSEDDWKSIPGWEDVREEIIIHYNATEPSEVWLNEVDGDGTNNPISVTFECDNPSVGGDVIAVLIKDGVVTDTVTIPAENIKEISFELGKTGTDVQVLWWKSFDNMSPVTETVSKEI